VREWLGGHLAASVGQPTTVVIHGQWGNEM